MLRRRDANLRFRGLNEVACGDGRYACDALRLAASSISVEITGGVREVECRTLLQNFFAEQRAKGKPANGDNDV